MASVALPLLFYVIIVELIDLEYLVLLYFMVENLS